MMSGLFKRSKNSAKELHSTRPRSTSPTTRFFLPKSSTTAPYTQDYSAWLSARSSKTPTSMCRAGQKYLENSTDRWRRVGVFATLTNAYAIVAVGASENFYRYVERRTQAPRKGYGMSSANVLRAVFLKPNSRMSFLSATPQSLELVSLAV
jgi:hypothetical protein